MTVTLLSKSVFSEKLVIWNERMQLILTQDYILQESTFLSDLEKNIDQEGIYLVYVGEADFGKSDSLEYNPISAEFRYYKDNRISIFSGVADTTCIQEIDPLADGLWVQVKKSTKGIFKLFEKRIKSGVLDGKFIKYQDGTTVLQEMYKGGFNIDTSYGFDSLGELVYMFIYSNNCNIVKQYIQFYQNGNVAVYYDLIVGRYLMFYENGTIQSIQTVDKYLRSVDEEIQYDSSGCLKH